MAEQFSISILFRAVDQATAPIRRIGMALRTHLVRAAEEANMSVRKLIGAMTILAGSKMKSLGRAMFLAISLPLAGIGLFALKSTADLEQLHITLSSMLQSEEKAKKLTEDLVTFAARTPYEMKGIGDATRQMMAAGIATEDMIETLRILGDISSVANRPIEETASIFSKIRMMGKAQAIELRQLSIAGIPVIRELAQHYNTTEEAIYEMGSQGKITFEAIMESMKRMTSKGGIAYRQMEKQSKSLYGVWSTLKDTIFLSMAEIGEIIEKTFDLKNNIEKLSAAIERGVKWFKSLSPEMQRTIIILGAVVIALGPVLIGFGMLTMAIGAIIASPVAAAILGVAAALAILSESIIWAVKNWKDLIGAYKELTAEQKVAMAPMMALAGQIKVITYMVKDYIEKIRMFYEGVYIAITDPLVLIERLWERVKIIIAGIREFISGVGGFLKSFGTAFGKTLSITEAAKIAIAGEKSETEIKIKVSAEDNVGAILEGITRKKGKAKVAVNIESSVGRHIMKPIGAF